jgi:hypothetical protein
VDIRLSDGIAAVDTGRIRNVFAGPAAGHHHWIEQLHDCLTSTATSHG